MTDYPMDFGNGYKIQTVYANKLPDGKYGDIYDFLSDVEKEHPGSEVMKGYCVIDEALGLVPDGCNDWNDTIAAAIEDYERHIVPVLEREIDIELNSTELDENGNTIREILYTVKSGWLQDYFGVDNSAQLEALLTNGDDWDPTEILRDARKEPELSGLCIGPVTEQGIHEMDAYELFDLFGSMRTNPHYQIAADMVDLQHSIELDDPLSPETLYILASKLAEASGTWFNEPLLHQEHLDAIRYLIEYGINARHSPEFPKLSPENTLQLLLTADNQVFGTLVEVAAINSRDHYEAFSSHLDLNPVISAIEAIGNEKQPLCKKISAAMDLKGKQSLEGEFKTFDAHAVSGNTTAHLKPKEQEQGI